MTMDFKNLAIFAQLGLGAWASEMVPRQGSFQDQCLGFNPANADIANASITNHAFVAAGTSLNLTGNDVCGQTSQTVPVDLCRVSLQIATTNRSGVVAEVWLPQGWNGRLVTAGNGGLAGCQCSTQYESVLKAKLSEQIRYRLCDDCLHGEQWLCKHWNQQRPQRILGASILE